MTTSTKLRRITQNYFYSMPNISFIQSSGTTMDFQNWSKTAIIGGFTRKATRGESTDVNVERVDLVTGGWQFTGCEAGGRLPVTLELTHMIDGAS